VLGPVDLAAGVTIEDREGVELGREGGVDFLRRSPDSVAVAHRIVVVDPQDGPRVVGPGIHLRMVAPSFAAAVVEVGRREGGNGQSTLAPVSSAAGCTGCMLRSKVGLAVPPV
jgi:hypothetical protein